MNGTQTQQSETSAKPRPKGPWISRFAISFFTVVLAVLIFWLLGFFMRDIRSIRGPDYLKIEKKHVDQGLVDENASLDKRIRELSRLIDSEKETQRLVGDSSQNLQQTINQLLELQKLGLEKNMTLSPAEQSNFTSSLSLFLDNQKKYQGLNQTIVQLLEQKRSLEDAKRTCEQKMEEQRKPARAEFESLNRRHKIRLATYQLAILIPILAVAVFLIIRKRRSIYFPLFLALAASSLIKVGLVIHEYFPTRTFKYVLIAALILVVARILVYFIHTIAFPKAQWLMKQYREAYERFLCPVCEYPIRMGPRRFLFWTRRTVNKMVVPNEQAAEEPYTCPSCGATLFEECPSCHHVRHSLLPHCKSCGAQKETT